MNMSPKISYDKIFNYGWIFTDTFNYKHKMTLKIILTDMYEYLKTNNM